MTIEKMYEINDEDSIKLIYTIKVSSGDKNNNIILYDYIEHIINIGEDLSEISEFEKEAEEREKKLKEKAVKLADMAKQLESMGYKRNVDDDY